MGIFSFNKDSGAKSTEMSDDARAKFMEEIIKKYNFKIENLEIKVQSEKASVWGNVEENSIKEKIVLGIGNIKGISEVEDHIEVAANDKKTVQESKLYTVEKGDSLSKISKAVYGDAMKYNLIFEANKPMLKDPNKIYPGQVLRIPNIY